MRHLTATLLTRAASDAADERTVQVLAVPYDTTLHGPGGYSERVAAGAVDVDTLAGLPMLWRHDEPIGRWDTARVDTVDGVTGPVLTGRVSDVPTGATALTLLRDGAVTGASIGFDPVETVTQMHDGEPVQVHTRIVVREVSLTPTPAYTDARVLAVREGTPRMTTTTTDAGEQLLARAAVDAAAMAERHNVTADTVQQVRELAQRLTAVETAGRTHTHPLGQHRTFGDYAQAVAAGTETRAWVDQITPDNPGVVPPAWLQEVRGIVEAGRPAIAALGGPRALPAAGMALDYPYYDGGLADLVAEQTAEKTEIASRKASFKRGSSPIRTFAGGSDVSLQLIERSSPSYVDAYLRILTAAYAMVTEAAFVATVAAVAVAGPALDTSTPASIRTFIRKASRQVQRATGSPATAWVVASDVYDTLDVTVPGTESFLDGPTLTPTELPDAPAGLNIVTNGQACAFHEDGPRTISQDVVRLLGRDYAVYGFLAMPVYLPAGVVKAGANPVEARTSK